MNGQVKNLTPLQCAFFNLMILAPECPDGYEYVPHLSDGRSCHGIIEDGEGDFETSTCDSGNDILRKKYTPMNPLQIDRFRRHFK